jgi:hypothetical protein
VKKQLCGWVEPFGIEVFWEHRSPPLGYKVFKTGYKKTPDLLFRFGNEAVLVEVKSAAHHSNVYNAFFQILGYRNDIETVTIGTEIVAVTGFVVATQYSIYGHLFHHDILSPYRQFTTGRQQQADNDILPRNEYALTEMFTRLLWRGTKEGRDSDVFIGSFVSDRIHHGSPTPAILGSARGKQFFMLLNSPKRDASP